MRTLSTPNPPTNERPRRILCAAVLALSLTPTLAARADTSLRREADLRRALAESAASMASTAPSFMDSFPARGKLPSDVPDQIIGTTPRLSVIARDWARADALGNITVTDQLRPSRSTRVLMARVQFSRGRINPFVHVGVGQWRLDPLLFPDLPAVDRLTGQAGAGLEWTVSRTATVGLEANFASLYREGRQEGPLTGPSIVSTFVAARFTL